MHRIDNYSRIALSGKLHKYLLGLESGGRHQQDFTISFMLPNGDMLFIVALRNRYAKAFHKSKQRGTMDKTIKALKINTIYHARNFIDAVDVYVENMRVRSVKESVNKTSVEVMSDSDFDFLWE